MPVKSNKKTMAALKRAGIRISKFNRKFRVARALSNPQPVFTETCRLARINTSPPVFYQMNANSTGQLSVQMDTLPQLSQYSTLYQKYRILKVQYLMLGTYNTQSSDINAAQSNLPTAVTYGMGRIAHVVQSSPGVPLPVNEDSVLTCNGAKVISARPKFTIKHRPVPNLLDASGSRITMKSPFIDFVTTGFNVEHGAVNWSYILPGSNQALDPLYAVYAKITFQLSDPR